MTILASTLLVGTFFILLCIKDNHKSLDKFEILQDWTWDLDALKHQEKSPYTYNGRNVVTTPVP